MNEPSVSSALARGLRRLGVGERVLKTGLAVGLAWELGSLLPVTGGPYLAPLAALLSMQITVADSLTAATQRVLGIIVGVTVAIGVTAVVGVNGFTAGILVALSLAAGSVLRLGAQAVQQVAVSALLLVAVGTVSSFGYAVGRILETLVGAAVGVGVNALLAPPTHLAAAREAVIAHATDLAGAMQRLSDALAAGIDPAAATRVLDTARATDAGLRSAQEAVTRTETAHRFNIWHRDEQTEVYRLKRALRTQERVAIQTRGIVRTIDEAISYAPSQVPWLASTTADGGLAKAIGGIAAMIGAFPAAVHAGPGSPAAFELRRLGEQAENWWERVAREPIGIPGGDEGDHWIALGSVLADLGRIRRELMGAVEAADDIAPPPPTTPSDLL